MKSMERLSLEQLERKSRVGQSVLFLSMLAVDAFPKMSKNPAFRGDYLIFILLAMSGNAGVQFVQLALMNRMQLCDFRRADIKILEEAKEFHSYFTLCAGMLLTILETKPSQ